MFDMVFTAKNGVQIVFDDYADDTAEYQSYWAGMCPQCQNKYKSILDRTSIGAVGICSVKGCQNEAEYYVDFEKKDVQFIKEEGNKND